MKDSFCFARKLDHSQISTGAKFIKVDVKDFFLSGEHSEIVEISSQAVSLEFRDHFKQLCSMILRSQYVTIDAKSPSEAWQVCRGTGIGLSCAGDLSNTVFALLVETPFITRPQVRARFGIEVYSRFMDDILMVVRDSGRQSRFELADELRSRARFFQLELEVRSTSVKFLDFDIFFGERFQARRLLDYRVSQKASSIAVPLRQTSAHPWSIHSSWPRGMLKRVALLCSSRADITKAREAMYQKWASAHIDHEMFLNRTRPAARMLRDRLHPEVSPPRVHRLILPFHDAWMKSRWSRILRDLKWRLLQYVQYHCVLQTSWSLEDKHMVVLLRALHDEYHTHGAEILLNQDL